MDKLDEQKIEKKTKDKRAASFYRKIKESFESIREDAKSGGSNLIFDLLIFSIGFLFSRCQLMLGARPVGLALISVLPVAVWPCLGGALVGSLSMGIDGIIFASAAIIITLLRAAMSGREIGQSEMFGEGLMLRMSISIIGGFSVAVYEVLTQGLNEATLIYGLIMIILTPILTFVLSGLFSEEINLRDLIEKDDNILTESTDDRRQKNSRIFFQISTITLIFFVSLSLKYVNIFGISLSYVFSAMVTLMTAKRFGALRGMTVGFVSSLCVSSGLAVSFALGGLCSGIMFGFGTGYAIIVGGIALCAWSAYSFGLTGLLSTLPEYSIASALVLPLLKRIKDVEIKDDNTESAYPEPQETAEDMVGTMALAYQSRYQGSLGLMNLSKVMKEYSHPSIKLTEEEYRNIVIGIAENRCIGCAEGLLCATENIRPSIKNADKLARLLWSGKKIKGSDLNTDTEFCHLADILADEINREAARKEKESYELYGSVGASEEYEMFSQLISQARENDINEKSVDNSMTGALTDAFRGCGFTNGTIRAFGSRKKHFILAGEDENGVKISSFELRKSVEKAAGVKLDTPEYFRRGKMVLMECDCRPSLKVSYATATASRSDQEISGDTTINFETEKGYFYSFTSDGMGSGAIAKETSRFAADFIKSAMEIGAAKETIILMLNHSIRARREECSATVDLFELDLLNGNGVFLKSGAAPSYVKRESSLFRIRSQTAPIGLLKSIDTEKINVEIKAGDHIFIMSDGIADSAEDAPWLLLLLGDPPKKNLKEYATLILNEAKINSKSSDDMSITVIRVDEV